MFNMLDGRKKKISNIFCLFKTKNYPYQIIVSKNILLIALETIIRL